MVDNPCNDAKRGAHVVCKRDGVIEWRGLASSSPRKLLEANNYSTWRPRFYTWSQNVQLKAIQEFLVGNRKNFLDGW
jgi:hypothetical protein